MFVSDIKSGMKGFGKTVFHGIKVEKFNVEIIDIISGDHNIGEFILAKLNGKQLEEVGGISAGMSGSPVYIKDKLIGAISYTWELSEHNLCLITPIEEMLSLLDFPYASSGSNAREFSTYFIHDIEKSINGNMLAKYGKLWKNPFQYNDGQNTKSGHYFLSTATPITVTGLTGRSFDNFNTTMKKFNLRAVQGFNGLYQDKIQDVGESPYNKVEPGSAISIQLTRGDVNISSIGTVTYRQGNRLLALGHPFLRKGKSDYFLSSVYIYHSLPNMVMPFKIGTPLNLIGHVSQDREAGIVGVLNSYPQIIPLKIDVENLDSGVNYQMGIQLVDDNFLLEPFMSNFIVQAIDNALDSVGKGSAQVEIEINGINENHKIFRKNMYCSINDIALETIVEIPEIVELITNNYFEKINLTRINIHIGITNALKCGRIEEVNLNKKLVKPGSTFEANVKIRTFRGGVIDQKITFQIPSSISEGEAVLIVKGGGMADQFYEEDDKYYQEKKYHNLKEAIANITERPFNSEIVAEIILYNNDILFSESRSSSDFNDNENKNSYIKRVDTEMVIEGYIEIPFTISR